MQASPRFAGAAYRSSMARAALAGAWIAHFAACSVAQAVPPTKDFQNSEFRYTVSLPAGCRHQEGPGTLEAVCSAEFDPDRSADASAAASLVLQVGAETVAEDQGKTGASLAQAYGEAQFKQELPETVCGQDKDRVKIANVKQVIEAERVVYTADVTCSEVKFLGLDERQAEVQYQITPGVRYRLMARAQQEDFEQHKDVVTTFFSSFRLLPVEKRTP